MKKVMLSMMPLKIRKIPWISIFAIWLIISCDSTGDQYVEQKIVEITYEIEDYLKNQKLSKRWLQLGENSNEILVKFSGQNLNFNDGQFGCSRVLHKRDSVNLQIGAYIFKLVDVNEYTFKKGKEMIHAERVKDEMEGEIRLTTFNFFWGSLGEVDEENDVVKVDLKNEIIYSIVTNRYKIKLVNVNDNSSVPSALLQCWGEL